MLSTVKTSLFFPLATTQPQLHNNGDAHPWDDGTILVRENGITVKKSIKNMNVNDFLSNNSSAEIQDSILRMMNAYSNDEAISHCFNFPIDTLPRNNIKSVDVDKPFVWTLSDRSRNANYFDTQIIFRKNGVIGNVNWSGRVSNGFVHSGDNTTNGVFRHSCKIDGRMPEGTEVFFGAVGYNKVKIFTLAEQKPSMCIVSNNNILVLPFVLERAVLGDATCCYIAYGRVENGVLNVFLLNTPILVNNTNFGDLTTHDYKSCFDRAGVEYEHIKESQNNSENISHIFSQLNIDELGYNMEHKNIVTIVETTCETITGDFYFGDRLSIDNSKSDVILPIPIGEICVGPITLLLGKQPFGMPKNYLDVIDNAKLVIIHISEKMLATMIGITDTLCNGIFILHPTNSKKDSESMSDYLNNLSITAITALAGPASQVFVEIDGRLYFFRGVRREGVLDNLPSFGDLMPTDFIESVNCSICKIPARYKCGTGIYINNELTPFSNVSDYFNNSIDILLEKIPEINDIIIQLSIVCSESQLNEIVNKMLVVLSNIQKDMKEKITKYINNSNLLSTELKTFIAEYKDFKTKINPLLCIVQNITSVKMSSSRKYDVNKLLRKNKISNNVQESQNMTADDVTKYLEDSCKVAGTVIGDINVENFKRLSQLVSQDKLLEYLQDNQSNIVDLSSKMPTLDSETTACLMEIAVSKGNNHTLGVEGSNKSLTFPLNDGIQCVPFPLFDEFVQMTDPSCNWVEKANETGAKFRILQRNAIANCNTNREYTISPNSKELGFLLVDMTFNLMEQLTCRLSSLPTTVTDTSCQIMRGLFGYLLSVLGSGKDPLSMAWQMVCKTTNLVTPEHSHLWIYSNIIKYFPYTLWSTENITDNKKLLCVLLVNKLTQSIRTNMQKQDLLIERVNNKNNVALYNKELELVYVCVKVLEWISTHKSNDDNKLIAQRTFDFINGEKFVSIPKSKLCTPAKLLKGVIDNTFWDNPINITTIQNIIAKRSNRFADVKKLTLETKDATALFQSVNNNIYNTPFNMRNKNAYVELDVEKMRGDAELYNKPWSMSKDSTIDQLVLDEYANNLVNNMPFEFKSTIHQEINQAVSVKNEHVITYKNINKYLDCLFSEYDNIDEWIKYSFENYKTDNKTLAEEIKMKFL